MKKARGRNGLERNCRYFELDFGNGARAWSSVKWTCS
jgi:hypothetical protein